MISFVDNKDAFSDTDWKSLYKLSENTFVEETDSSMKGAAGAGLTIMIEDKNLEEKKKI